MNSSSLRKLVLVDPSYTVFNRDKAFGCDDPRLNRDDQLLPGVRLKECLNNGGAEVHTADFLLDSNVVGKFEKIHYYSTGLLNNIARIRNLGKVEFKSFVIFEPPVVAPHLYANLKNLTKQFESVFVYNTIGNGYPICGVDQSKLRPLYFPLPYQGVLTHFWDNTPRMDTIVLINGNHNPWLHSFRRFHISVPQSELYSKRIEAVGSLSHHNAIHLFGPRWKDWWSPFSFWPPYWKHRKEIVKCYKGSCQSKYEVLSRYRFALCLENMVMDGYITEKIFDCFYAGTIPLYLGAPDIDQRVPREAFVDCRDFASWTELWEFVKNMPPNKVAQMREAGREFMASDYVAKHFHFLENIIT